MKPSLLALLGALASPPTLAHNLWIEPAGDRGLQVLYGEPEIRLTERSPGKLDGVALTRARRAGGAESQPLDWRRRGDGFVLHGAKDGDGALVEAHSVVARPGTGQPGGTQARRYYARHAAWPLSSTPPAMALDIVPTAQANTFAVLFNGAPLTHGTLKVIAPSLWLQVHDIDEQGRVRIHTPWRGTYVLDVETRERRAGEAGGRQDDGVVHRATLTFTVPDGPPFEDPRPAQYRAD